MSKATDAMRRINLKHGEARAGQQSAEYHIWAGMKRRCDNANDTSYRRYGGRGIRVCRRWRESFTAFLGDMGRRPSPQHTLDRIKGARGYYPGNVRWATPLEQSRNRKRQLLSARGRRLPIWAWATESGLPIRLIWQRVYVLGWKAERAIFQIQRSQQRYCKNGHLLSGRNLRYTTTGSRRCLTCWRAYQTAWRERQRAA